MSKLLDYLNLLDSDAAAVAAHNADPAAAMTQFGLSANEQQTFMSGDMNAIATLTGIDPTQFPKVQVHNVDDTY